MFAEQILAKARQRLAVVTAGSPITEAADLMSKPHTDLVVVCDRDGHMIGVLTKTDIVRQIRRCSGHGNFASVDAIMTRSVFSCRPGDALQDIWSVMKERGLQRIPLIDERNRPIGIIYTRDALQALLSESKDEESLLRDYVMNVGYR